MTSAHSLEQLLLERIATTGPLRYSEYIAEALYNPTFGFYSVAGRAGRRGDFLTSPEVGPLFGACIARYLDEVWSELGEPSPFVVVEAGAGPGTLARGVLAAAPRCLEAMEYVAVEVSAAQRADHPDGVLSVEELPGGPVHVVIANELLDNLPFDLVTYTGDGWCSVLVGAVDGELVEVTRPMAAVPNHLPADIREGGRIPVIDAAVQWCRDAIELVESGRVLLFDYSSGGSEIIVNDASANASDAAIRTYRGNQRGDHPLADPGSQDITAQIPDEQLAVVAPRALQQTSQAEFLRAYGIEELVDEGRRLWKERAHLGDLRAMQARSRIAESEALLDPSGLGGFSVFEWRLPELG